MSAIPKTAMLLAAGLGTRMRPLTADTAKTLLVLDGRTLMDHALDRLAAVGVNRVVVNAHWRADKVSERLAARMRDGEGPETIVLREEALLETGGSVHAALELLGADPFFVVNGDAFWLNGPHPALARLSESFDAETLDGVLLVQRTCQVHADVGAGDFTVDPWGLMRRRTERQIAPYVFAGVQIATPALFRDSPAAPFSMNTLWDRAIAQHRLRALVHDGLWFHLSTPRDLEDAEHLLSLQAAAETT
jgi:N-acetyl-alpha-D-muramate 1-phosphate uridylyltransferase